MAKTLKVGEVFPTPYGTEWDAAILVADDIYLDFNNQTMIIQINIYADSTARTELKEPLSEKIRVDKPTFLAEFDGTQAITTLNTQSEDYILTLTSLHFEVLLSDLFE